MLLPITTFSAAHLRAEEWKCSRTCRGNTSRPTVQVLTTDHNPAPLPEHTAQKNTPLFFSLGLTTAILNISYFHVNINQRNLEK